MIEDITAYESKTFPISKFTLIILFLAINMTVVFLVNLKYLQGKVNFRPCTADYYTLSVFALLMATYLTLHACKILQLEQQAKKKVRGSWPFLEHIQYTNGKLVLLCIFGLGAGFLGTTVELGCDVYVVGMMLFVGFSPLAISVTSLFIVGWSNMSYILLFMVNNSIDWPYMIMIGSLMILTSGFSNMMLEKWLAHTKREILISLTYVGCVLVYFC
jgi:hypothetical protein